VEPRPLLVYDGDCGFCKYWVNYWDRMTQGRVAYEPFQTAAARYPAIPEDAFKKAVQYITPDGHYASAAEASFLVLSHAPGKGHWLALYRRFPLYAWFSERVYEFVSRRRGLFYAISKFLWGPDLRPPRHEMMSWLFLRLFGLIALSAFMSFGVQAMGLIGSGGITPLHDFVSAVTEQIGGARWLLAPMVFWWNDSDAAIQAVCWAGAAFSVLLTLGALPRLSLFMIYALYLSLVYGGQTFMTYQWDIFIVETAFAALLLAFVTTPGLWILRWLLFRFMFLSGCVKLLSMDPNWWNLHALEYHFLTQPLPTPLAWYAAQMPPGALHVLCGVVFVVEMLLPFLIFAPRRLRFAAAVGFMGLEIAIFLTGNYNWFNLQTMLLCLPLLDDQALESLMPRKFFAFVSAHAPVRQPNIYTRRIVLGISVLIIFCSLVQTSMRFGERPPGAFMAINHMVGPLQIANTYGLFAVMTTARNEIVVEGSDDGQNWKEYEFKYKPGDLTRRPPWNIPHQPRLDWQMWFAALEDPRDLPWFRQFLRRLLKNAPAVTALLAKNPFPDHPPRFVRAQFYDYTFATPAEHAKGIWWDRQYLKVWFPIAQLRHD